MLVVNMLVFLHSSPLDGACSQARNKSSLGLFCYHEGITITPQTQVVTSCSIIGGYSFMGICDAT